MDLKQRIDCDARRTVDLVLMDRTQWRKARREAHRIGYSVAGVEKIRNDPEKAAFARACPDVLFDTLRAALYVEFGVVEDSR